MNNKAPICCYYTLVNRSLVGIRQMKAGVPSAAGSGFPSEPPWSRGRTRRWWWCRWPPACWLGWIWRGWGWARRSWSSSAGRSRSSAPPRRKSDHRAADFSKDATVATSVPEPFRLRLPSAGRTREAKQQQLNKKLSNSRSLLTDNRSWDWTEPSTSHL